VIMGDSPSESVRCQPEKSAWRIGQPLDIEVTLIAPNPLGGRRLY